VRSPPVGFSDIMVASEVEELDDAAAAARTTTGI
jgi:hypothetical protein